MTEEQAISIFVPLAGFLLGAVLLWLAMRSKRLQRLMVDLPTSKTANVFIGLNELKGTAETGMPLTSYLAESNCVYYQYRVSEKWRRVVTERYTDSNGRSRTRTRVETGWDTVASGGDMMRFMLRDDHGALRIDPEGATVEPVTVFSQSCGRSHPLYYGKGPRRAVMNSVHRRQFTEHAIPLGQALYVLGQARERDDVIAAEIATHPDAPEFLISSRSEEEIIRSRGIKAWVYFVLGAIACVGGFYAVDYMQQRAETPRWELLLLSFTGYLCVAFWAWAWMVFNSVVSFKHRVERAETLIDIQLKRRTDLIPNLVKLAQEAAEHEHEVHETTARLRGESKAKGPRAPVLDILREAYPHLNSNENFLQLQQQLVDTETRIELARRYYNESVSFFNTRLQQVPDAWIAQLVGMKEREFLELDFENSFN